MAQETTNATFLQDVVECFCPACGRWVADLFVGPPLPEYEGRPGSQFFWGSAAFVAKQLGLPRPYGGDSLRTPNSIALRGQIGFICKKKRLHTDQKQRHWGPYTPDQLFEVHASAMRDGKRRLTFGADIP